MFQTLSWGVLIYILLKGMSSSFLGSLLGYGLQEVVLTIVPLFNIKHVSWTIHTLIYCMMLMSSPSSCRRNDPAHGDMRRRHQEVRLLFAERWSTIHVFYCDWAICSWTRGRNHDCNMGCHILSGSGRYGCTGNHQKHRGLPVDHHAGSSEGKFRAMSGKNQRLVTDELVEFEK